MTPAGTNRYVLARSNVTARQRYLAQYLFRIQRPIKPANAVAERIRISPVSKTTVAENTMTVAKAKKTLSNGRDRRRQTIMKRLYANHVDAKTKLT